MFKLWRFKSYVLPGGRDALTDWYDRQTDSVQGALDVLLEYLEQRTRDEWRRPEFDLLSGKMRDIGELRFKADRKQYRILGFFGPLQSEFTLLIGASKKGSQFDPKDALETALKRKNEIIKDGTRCHVFDL